MREWHARDEAWQRARSFTRRFGEPHVRLAMHGAVPIGLTPELLHLIRVNFVAAAPWVAEADLLLSPLCRDVGGGFFEMDEELRGLLVEELQRDPDLGPDRLKAVADFLGAWADRVRESASDPEWSDFVEGQALTALSYRKPEEAAEALARSLNSPQRGRAGIDARVDQVDAGSQLGADVASGSGDIRRSARQACCRRRRSRARAIWRIRAHRSAGEDRQRRVAGAGRMGRRRAAGGGERSREYNEGWLKRKRARRMLN